MAEKKSGRAATLTNRQRKFVDEYLIDLNAKQAAIRAGYSKKTADRIGPELLGKTCVAQQVEKRMRDRAARTQITQDRVLQEYAKIGFFDPRKLFDDDGKPIAIPDLDDDTAAALAGLDVQELYEYDGDEKIFAGYTKKYKLADKRAALDSIARHLGMFTDKSEVSLTAGMTIKVELTDD